MSENRIPPWLKGLNDQQIEAVTHGGEPLLILAGAGSGKTRVVTSRIAWMVAEKGFHAPSILAVTFTNKAAAEMRERVAALFPGAEGAMIRTFHSFGAWLLRRNASAAGLSRECVPNESAPACSSDFRPGGKKPQPAPCLIRSDTPAEIPQVRSGWHHLAGPSDPR